MTQQLDAATLKDHPLPHLPPDGDKEDRGAVLVVGGEANMAGAALLAGTAALRVGAGKLKMRSSPEAVPALAVAVPEARLIGARMGRECERVLSPEAARASALVIGPGMVTHRRNRRLARSLLAASTGPAVVDAGALPEPGEAEDFGRLAGGRVILTPHAGEMAALLGLTKEAVQADPLDCARKAAALYRSVILMKGVTSFVVTPDGASWRHDGGASGLGTSGSGDVLAGAIGGLLARGAPPVTALLWGVLLHARAGAALGAAGAPLGFLAREISSCFPALLARLDGAGDRG